MNAVTWLLTLVGCAPAVEGPTAPLSPPDAVAALVSHEVTRCQDVGPRLGVDLKPTARGWRGATPSQTLRVRRAGDWCTVDAGIQATCVPLNAFLDRGLPLVWRPQPHLAENRDLYGFSDEDQGVSLIVDRRSTCVESWDWSDW
jgi:hypothetical protein